MSMHVDRYAGLQDQCLGISFLLFGFCPDMAHLTPIQGKNKHHIILFILHILYLKEVE